MRAGCLAANSITPRAGSAKEKPMQSFRPAFESIILLGRKDDAPSRLNDALCQLLGNAKEKGAGAQVERILRTYALEIKNDIVLLTLKRLDELVRSTPADRLGERLANCEALMREFHDAADSVPAVMANVARMPGCKELSLKSMRAVISAGLSKSSSLCPKEVTASIQREYESGALDSIREIAQARDAAWAPEAAFVPQAIAIHDPAPAANPGQAQPPTAETPACLVHEALPIIHYLSVKNVEEAAPDVRSFSQAVPEIVASGQRDKIRRGKEEGRARQAQAVRLQAPAAARDIQLREAPPRPARAAQPDHPAPRVLDRGGKPKAAENAHEAPKVRSERKTKAADMPAAASSHETRHRARGPGQMGMAVGAQREKEAEARKGTAGKGAARAKRAPRQKPEERKASPKKALPARAKPKTAKRMNDKAAPQNPKSEGLMKKGKEMPARTKTAKAAEKRTGRPARSPLSAKKRRRAAKIKEDTLKKKGRSREAPRAQTPAQVAATRPKEKTARAVSWSCSLILRKPVRAKTARKAARHAAAAEAPVRPRESRRKAPRSVARAVRVRRGEILFKLGL